MTHGWRASTLLSQWLDVPEISIRNWYLPHLMQHPAEVPYLFTNKHGGPDLREYLVLFLPATHLWDHSPLGLPPELTD